MGSEVPEDTTRGEGSGVNTLEGRCNVDPLGVRIGEEVVDPLLRELKDLALGIRIGVVVVVVAVVAVVVSTDDDVAGKFSVCILSACWFCSSYSSEESPIPPRQRKEGRKWQFETETEEGVRR